MPSKKRNIHIIPDRLIWIMDHMLNETNLSQYWFAGFIKENHPNEKKNIRQLSNDTGISEKTIYTARTTGNISPETLNNICKVLNRSPSYLLGENDKKYDVLTIAKETNLKPLSDMDEEEFDTAIKHAQEDYSVLKACNKIDDNDIYIPEYKPITSAKMKDIEIEDFIKKYMKSDNFQSFTEPPLEYEELEPNIKEFIPIFKSNLNDSISKFMKKKRMKSSHD